MARLRGILWLTAGLVVALLAGTIAYVTLSRAALQSAKTQLSAPRVTVVRAARALASGAILSSADLQTTEVPAEVVPEGALRSIEDAVGKVVLTEHYPGELLVESRIVRPNVVAAGGRLALLLEKDKVLVAYPARDLLSQAGLLKPGDRVDLLVSVQLPRPVGAAAGVGTDQATFALLQDVTVVGFVWSSAERLAASRAATAVPQGAERPPEAVLFALTAQDALVLKYAIDAQGTVELALRSPGEGRPITTESVDMDWLIHRYGVRAGPAP